MSKSKQIIKEQLWRLNHKVKDVSGMPGVHYDLLVDGKTKVCIIGSHTEKLADCDVIAVVSNGKKRYRFNKGEVEWKTPTKIFGNKKGPASP